MARKPKPAKPWEATIEVQDTNLFPPCQWCWFARLNTSDVSIEGGKLYRSKYSARHAARRVLKRLNLVETKA